jgi:SAM-dependent methyltransferase
LTVWAWALGAAAALVALVSFWYVWTRTHPSPCPYSARFSILVPRPLLSAQRLVAALEVRRGQRILEIGPGIGAYTVPVARALGDQGTLDVFDIQQEMLDHTMRTAARRGLGNLRPALGSAEQLPYEDDTFDAVFMVTVLGEINDQAPALREMRRVLKPRGRLVVGEIVLDPDWITLGRLKQRATECGFAFERRLGNGFFSYFAAFRPA